jgi:type II secretory pathway component PulC
MNSASRSLQFTLWAAWAVLVASLVLGVWLVLGSSPRSGGADAAGIPEGVPVAVAPRGPFSLGQGGVFYAEGTVGSPAALFDRLFRLAGTFGMDGAGEGGERRAIVEVIQTGKQEIVGVGDTLGDVQVLAVLVDRVVLRGPSGRGVLTLGFGSHGATSSIVGETASGQAADGGTALGQEGRFGKQVSTNMWVFSRDSLETYYNELMEEPDRLLTVFDSLKPLRDEASTITGYRLGVEGESEFFSQIGMVEGDVVRRVNGIPMTNRRRAEYLIRKFSESKLNAFAIDIERGGKRQRLVYSLR